MTYSKIVFHRKVFLFTLYALAFAIPISGRLLPLLIGLLVLNWLVEGKCFGRFKLILSERPRFLMFSFSLLYFLYLAGLAYTTNFQYAGEDLETKFSILLFPVIFATSDFPLFSKKETGTILRFFAAGCIAGSVILLGQAFYSGVFLHHPGSYYYSTLSRGFHPSYYAMYLAFASSNILCFLLIRQTVKGFPKITGHIVILVFFTVMTVLLSSKAGLLVWLFIVVFYALVLFFLYKRRLMAFLFIASALTVFTVLLQIFPNAASRVSVAKQDLAVKDPAVDPEKSTGERMVIWKSAVEIIRENLLLGVGTGDVKDALLQRYKKNNLTKILSMRLNAHNQYLQTFVTIGISGFLVLVIMLLAPAISALRKADFIYFIFLAIIGINILVESMFEVQAGVIFYAVFNAILFSSNQSDPAHHPLDIPLSQV
jgi:O-antigen ligase